MLRFSTWKFASIIIVTLLAVLLTVPSMLQPASRKALKESLPSWIPAREITLGLDLQGGAHVLLEVDSPSVVKSMVDNIRDDVRRLLREEKVSISGGIGLQEGVIEESGQLVNSELRHPSSLSS